MTVANDQLTLATADGNHRINGLDARLQWLAHWLTVNHARRLALNRHVKRLTRDRALAVNGLTKHVHHTTKHAFSDLHRSDGAGALGGAALFQIARWLKQHGAHVVLLEVQHDATHPVFKFDQFAGLHAGQTIDACNSVSHLEDGAHFL